MGESDESSFRTEVISNPPESSPVSDAVSASIPESVRLAHEIPKPKDWQDFQRKCVVLYRAELNDPNAQEYGRSGQTQRGIDILGRRDNDPDHYVGVQCRRVEKPLKESEILKDCRKALELKAGLKEIIFATTAPDDTGATDAAIAVERTLRSEGHDLKVAIYGWRALETLIAQHEVAYAVFFPASVGTKSQKPVHVHATLEGDSVDQIATRVVEQLREVGIPPPPQEVTRADWAQEEPAVHARIDTLRDLIRQQNQPIIAEDGLRALLGGESLDGKPWARFRIETNLGSIAVDVGKESEAASHFEAAYDLQPDDPTAMANLALARTIQGRYDEAMDLARQALDANSPANHAVSNLLQAAARSAWEGDPESLIPTELNGSAPADFGLAEFIHRRNVPGWAVRNLELSRNHPDVPEFKRIGAIAVLEIAIESGSAMLGGAQKITSEELNRAADDMKAITEHRLNVGFAELGDLVANLNNAALLLRLAGRHSESEELIVRGVGKTPDDPQLRRLLALAQVELGRRADALEVLAADQDPENQFIFAELVAVEDVSAALDRLFAIDAVALSPRLLHIRWLLIGEFAFKVGDEGNLKQAVSGLRKLDPNDVTANLIEIRWDQKAGLDEETIHVRMRAVAAALPADADMATRCMLAEELRAQGLSNEAVSILESFIDLDRAGPTTTLYLQILADARRDDAFREAVAAATPEVREDPDVLWTVGAHAWNIGDLAGAYSSIEQLLKQVPDNPRARLFNIEILVRQNRSAELLAELDKPVESLTWRSPKDQFRIASLLGHFGYSERAAALAYRLYLENRDSSQAWMTLSVLVLDEGRGESERPRLWDAPVVAPNAAVDLRYDDGSELFLVIEPDAELRSIDNESWEPNHSLIKALMGLSNGTRFTGPDGREGKISQIRHKYVARLHYVMEHYETRFPEIEGFRNVPIDFESPGGLDGIIAELKARREWIDEEQETYRNGPWPMGVLAHRLGLDTIDVADGLTSQGIPHKVAIGNESERIAAARAVRANDQKGCVLDLLAFWTGWRLNALDAIAATCGPIHLARSVVDRMHRRREKIEYSRSDGLRSLAYEGGGIALQEAKPEMVQEWLEDVDRAIAWINANANVEPVVAGKDLPDALREQLRYGQSDIFDSLVLAMQKGILLVTDDLRTRELGKLLVCGDGAWLHQVFKVALEQERIDFNTFIRWSAHLIDAGHDYIGVTGVGLARALRLDAEDDKAPGYLFKALCKEIGGRNAEPLSHIEACVMCLRNLWKDPNASNYCKPATGLLLRHLTKERNDDYGILLRSVIQNVSGLPDLVEYIYGWTRGHFMFASTFGEDP